MLRTIIFLLGISTIISGCLLHPATTISNGADKKDLALLKVKKVYAHTRFLSVDERWNTFNIVSIDNQPISIFSDKIYLSPGPHNIRVICEFGHGAGGGDNSDSNTDSQFEHKTIQFSVKPHTNYELALNLPNLSGYYPHPCQYMQLKEAIVNRP